jgi:hypothetical protein
MKKSPSSGSSSVVECNLAKVDVAGSSPVSRSISQFGNPLLGFRSNPPRLAIESCENIRACSAGHC